MHAHSEEANASNLGCNEVFDPVIWVFVAMCHHDNSRTSGGSHAQSLGLPSLRRSYARRSHIAEDAILRFHNAMTSLPLCLSTSSSTTSSLHRVDLLAILVVPHSWRWCAVAAAFTRADTEPRVRTAFSRCGAVHVPNNLAVNGAGNAVLELQVHLGHGIFGEDGGI
jgi:hypothetical protein